MDKQTEYYVEQIEITPEEIQEELQSLRRVQALIKTFPEGQTKKDLEKISNLASDFICEILYEHGIEDFEDMVSFENGDFKGWRYEIEKPQNKRLLQ